MKRLWSVFRSRRLERDLDDEIGAHLAMQEEEFRRAGMSAREARDAARREFGGVAQVKEAYRDRRGLPWVESAAKDFRLALRGLRQNKGFAAAAVLSLALGIGANTAIFTIFRALMLRSLPVARPEELATLYRTGGWGRGYSSYPLYLEVRKRTDLFQDAIARSSVDRVRLTGQPDRVETVQREFVTGNYFGVLGLSPALGRLIAESDDRTRLAHPVAVLSYEFWQGRFGGDPSVLGRSLVVDQQPFTIIGVGPRGFRGIDIDKAADVWLPVMMRREDIMDVGRHWVWIVARRRPDVSRAQLQAAMDVMFRQYLARVYGEDQNPRFRKVALAQQIEVREGGAGLSGLRDRFGASLRVLMAAVGLVLLAACANVANLLLARGAARRKEIALRVSLGATRARLVQQGLMESFVLAALGAAAGITLAYWGTGAILAFLPEPFLVTPDAAVLGYTAALAVGAAILFGLGPALRSAGVDPAADLRLGAGARDPRPTMRRALVAAQVAFSVVLVAMAVLFGHSMTQLRSVNVGFANQGAVAFAMDEPPAMDAAQRKVRRDRLIERIERIPGVAAVSFAFPGPFLGGTSNANVRIAGSEAKEESWSRIHTVGPRYFATIGATLAAGRDIERTDTAQSLPVCVVNEAFVRQYLDGEPGLPGRLVMAGSSKPMTIVGVVRDMAHDGLRNKPRPAVYMPDPQYKSDWEPTIVARASIPPETLIPAIRREVAGLGMLLDGEPKPLQLRIDQSIFQERLLATIGGFFGILALSLAAVGLYGVVSYGAARRAREIGIRIALGARRGEVVWLVLRDALALVGAGLLVGLPMAYAAARQVGALLFDVKPLDPATFAITAAVLAGIGGVAVFVPARRAAGVEPLAVLRQE